MVTALEDKPTICSGSTMGEQVAIETYLRAMVNESDETGTKLMGADQGFHNYLYYSNKLANANSIKSITVFDQGFAIINNLGAMRTKELVSVLFFPLDPIILTSSDSAKLTFHLVRNCIRFSLSLSLSLWE